MAQRASNDLGSLLANLGASATVGGLCHAAERRIRWADKEVSSDQANRAASALRDGCLLPPWAVASELGVTTDLLEYAPEQTITISVTNESETVAFMSCAPPFWVYPVGGGRTVAQCACFTWVWELPAGETQTYEVPQVDGDTSLPSAWPPGMYLVSVYHGIGGVWTTSVS